MRKHIFTLALIAVLSSSMAICPAMTVSADAIQETEQITDTINQEEQTYIYDDVIKYINCGDHIKITSVGSRSAIVIPEEIDNLPVTELADGLFENNYGIESVCLPETIKVIPERAFYNAYDLTAIVLPASLEKIEGNAFAKCERDVCAGNPVYHKIEDIFYRGTASDWDNVYISEGNDLLKSANVRCEFNKIKSDAKTFEFGKHNWSFTSQIIENYNLYHMRQYYVQESTLDTLFPEYGSYAKYIAMINCDYVTHANPLVNVNQGMALISFLVSRGVLAPSDIYAGAETLYDIPLCDEVVEVINYYSMAVPHEALYSRLYREYPTNCSYLPDIKDALENLKNGTPVMLDCVYAEGERFSIGYGLEYGEWHYNNQTYTSRILTYDDSGSVDYTDETSLFKFSDRACIYFTEEETGDFTRGYVPFYDSGDDSENESDTNMALVTVLQNPDLIFYSTGNSVSYVSSYNLGDLNQDASINSEDASLILQASALLGAGSENNLIVGQEYAADVNEDGIINSEDASIVLQYSAATGSGEFTGDISEFILQINS